MLEGGREGGREGGSGKTILIAHPLYRKIIFWAICSAHYKCTLCQSVQLVCYKINALNLLPFSSRWIRLLFGREFPLPSVLEMWDALFADGPSLGLMDYIFVAMLMHIREVCKLTAVHSCHIHVHVTASWAPPFGFQNC